MIETDEGREKKKSKGKASCPGEAISTFIRASRDPKGETQYSVTGSKKSTKVGILRPKQYPNTS